MKAILGAMLTFTVMTSAAFGEVVNDGSIGQFGQGEICILADSGTDGIAVFSLSAESSRLVGGTATAVNPLATIILAKSIDIRTLPSGRYRITMVNAVHDCIPYFRAEGGLPQNGFAGGNSRMAFNLMGSQNVRLNGKHVRVSELEGKLRIIKSSKAAGQGESEEARGAGGGMGGR